MNKLWKKAQSLIPGGNTLLSKRPNLWLPNKWPTHFKKAKDLTIIDANNNKFEDFVFAVGTNVLGYSNKKINKAVISASKNGSMTSINCIEELEFAEEILSSNKWAKMVKFARSGGEANTIALRLARCFTKNKNIAFCGYHGWHDWYVSSNLSIKDSLNSHLITGINFKGIPNQLGGIVFPFKYNDYEGLENLINTKNIGIIIMEVKRYQDPIKNFLNKIRNLCNKKNIILIFDECTTGYRENYGGLFNNYNITPDLAMFGKAIGNGYAINAVVGKEEIMKEAKHTFISSTFWGERIGFAAGLATLREMKRIKSWKIVKNNGEYIIKKWKQIALENKVELEIIGISSIPTMKFEKNNLEYKTLIAQELLKKKMLASNIIYVSILHDRKRLKNYFYELNEVFKKIKKYEDSKSLKKILKNKIVDSHFSRLN
jgi:glutamate-1-semialdehyde 2,1-aminomutase